LSLFAGIFYLRGRTADQNDCAVLTSTIGLGDCEQSVSVLEGSLAMACQARHTNRESYLDTQPLRSREGHIVVFNGRLDNRDELLRNIGQSPDAEYSDARIVLSLYERLAQDSFSKLIGDFAFVVWDAARRQLILVRDPFGTRMLYYRPLADAILWSTKLNHLTKISQDICKVNDEYLFDFLLGQPTLAETPYKGIYAVEPGTSVVVKNAGLHNSHYWRPDPKHRIQYKSDRDYEEHFRHIFKESVRNRLRVSGVVCKR
jgi:asparagine synthase (glutamine-hydrolysing)